MEIYADDHNDLVYVGDGPYTVLNSSGPTGVSSTPRDGALVHGGEPDIDAYAQGFDDGVTWKREQVLRQSICAEADRRRLTFRVALRYRPMTLKSTGGRP
jgi:hypothetical protein